MQALSARDTKYTFGLLLDMACVEPISKNHRAVVVVLVVKEYKRLKEIESE